MNSRDELLRDREWPAKAKGARGDLQSGRSLLALVFVLIHVQRDVAHQLQIEAVMIGNLLGAAQVLDVGLQNSVQDIVGRQAVLVLLVGTQLRRRSLVDGRPGNQFPLAVNPVRQCVHHQFWHIGNDGKASRHVSVQCAVADGEFRFVAGAQNHRSKLVGERHQVISADASLNVFFRHVNRPVAERGSQRPLVFFKHIRDRQGDELDAKILRQGGRIFLASCRRKRSRHGNSEHIRGPQRVYGNGSDYGRVNTTAQADENLLKPAFAHIVRRASQQRLVGIGDFRGRLLVNVAFPRGRIKQDQILPERQGLRGYAPIGGYRHARAVKNQIVVAAKLIDVHHGELLLHGDSPQHLNAQVSLVNRVRRSGNIQQDAGSLLAQFHHRVALVQARRPEVRIVPHILANGDAQGLVLEAVNYLLIGRLKVPRLVEYIVGRQQHLALLKHNSASAQQRRFVGHRFARGILDAPSVADEARQRNFRRKFFQFIQVPVEKGWTFQKILRRITAEAELGKNSKVRSSLLGLSSQVQDASGIPQEIADGGIELRERYFHAGTLGYGGNPKIANIGRTALWLAG